MLEALTYGLTLGLATGITCLASCGPVYGTFLLSERRRGLESLWVILLLNAGRFIAYALFGLIIGSLGGSLPEGLRQPIAYTGYILFSAYLLLSVRRASQSCKGCAPSPLLKITRSPFLLGLLTGFSICPAFLIALTGAFQSSGPLSGMVLFLGFYAGTTVYMLPFAFAGLLTRKARITSLARLMAVIVGLYFGASGAWGLFDYYFRGNPRILATEQELQADLEFVVAEAEAITLISCPGDSLDHGGELAPFLESETMPTLRHLRMQQDNWNEIITTIPRGSILAGPAWLDPRSEVPGKAWQDSLRGELEDRALRLFAIDYEPFCADYARNIHKIFQDYRFQCSSKKGGRWLILNPRGCAAADCASCKIPHGL